MSDVIRVEELHVDNFRRLKKVCVPIGPRVTLIAGQNGTAKSTILGMLAQPFSFGVVRGKTAGAPDASAYLDNYHGLILSEYIDYTDKPYMYDCSDVFRLSKEFDYGKSYQYTTRLIVPGGVNLPDDSLLTVSRNLEKNGEVTRIRFVTGPGLSHGAGEGNFPHPVIYLGLNRLWPLAASKTCSFLSEDLRDEDREWYVQTYSDVLCLDEFGNEARYMDTVEKRTFITPKSEDYDGESCSAGQDNLSQILTAILSFRYLKELLGKKYRGGLLLIDEVDATFHASAQAKLLELLCETSEELDLQVVATSHSLRLLELAFKSKSKNFVNVVYLSNIGGNIVVEDFESYQDIADHLALQSTKPKMAIQPKVTVLFEDSVARFFFNQICGSKLRNYIRTVDKSYQAGFLKSLGMFSEDIPELKKVILVADGDMSAWKSRPKNLLFLPGDPVRPETLIYRHLFDLPANDPFWRSCARSYSRQECIISSGGRNRDVGDDKRWVKNWYAEQSPFWGKASAKAFKSWAQAHKSECFEFSRDFIKLLKSRLPNGIPKDVENKVLDQFR